MSETSNFPQIVHSAIQQAGQYPAQFQSPIVLARVLSGLMVPALKQVSGYNQQPRIYTHPDALTTDGSVSGETATGVIRFTSNADFLMTGLSVINGNDGTAAFSFDLQMVFGANDRNLVNRAAGIHAEALVGTERAPWAMPKAFAIRKNSTINVTLTTTTTHAIARAFVYLMGIDYLDGNVLDATRTAF